MSDLESSENTTPEATEPAAPEQPAAAPVEPAPVAAASAPAETAPTEPFVPLPGTPAASAAPASGQVPPSLGGSAAQPSPAADAPKRQRSVAVPVIAAAIVAALLGGGAGAGVAAWAITSQQAEQSQGQSQPQTITVNNPDGADVVTAVAAKALDSVVTIRVSSSSSGGSGSGVILSSDGYVLTNTHVVTLDGASADGTIEVTTADGRIFPAKVVGLDPLVDLAVIKLQGASGLTAVEWGDSTKLDVGDQVVAIGAPLGLSNTVTDGIVSALGRSIQIQSSAVPDSGDDDATPDDRQNGGQGPFDFWNFDPEGGDGEPQQRQQSSTISLPVIQTDAAINPGNSGGALLNDTGQLVGINVAIASTGGSLSSSQSGSIGVGFAIPSSLAKRVAEEIIENGEATHGLLGATVSTATSAESDVVGAVIQDVTPGGAADKAGLKEGDVVTRFNGTAITSSTDLTAQVRALAAGADAELVYQRGGAERTVDVTLGELQL
ncbi:trypsin-like peptidase domain-containing protein [Protaetiibacter sp. SSC-01]|uniref:S1C family serine protease n=1 Tax=Protaetiibacter sp. SSC-01 TaxID=2759943 RepID=UPI001656C60B|nr:trypsin-like peptidase domain-containing protein [Protaetiibacter sp. SSC-01]QNO38408.1 trypsin-like peptidase domain-containing protein [Protaetiibacter sp. SSC-01]